MENLMKKEKAKLEEQKGRMYKQITENRKKKDKLKICQEKIDNLLKVMKISDLLMIESTYEDLE